MMEMRLRIMEAEKIEGTVDFGEDKQTRVSSMEGNWEKMEVYEGAEAGGAQRQKRGIFMRDNIALARSLFWKCILVHTLFHELPRYLPK